MSIIRIRRLPLAVVVAALASTALLPAATAEPAGPTCFGLPATYIGTSADDTVVTDAGEVDVIWAGAGDDYLSGEVEGDGPSDPGDYFCGGPGDDTIMGGDGPDHIRGGRSDDDLDGWRGADVILGNADNDRVTDASISSNDRTSADILRGGQGDDAVSGGWGQDELYGNGGTDEIRDAECDGPTLLNGGPGDDSLQSWNSSFDAPEICDSATDRVLGRAGDDTAKVDRRDVVTTVERVTRVRPAA